MAELERVRKFFENDVFATAQAGIVIEEIGENYSKCTMQITPVHKNAANQVMGGAIFTLADFSFAVATNRPDKPITVTTSTNISFVGTAKGNTLIGETKLLKDGKRSCFFEVTIKDELGNLVAIATSVGTHL